MSFERDRKTVEAPGRLSKLGSREKKKKDDSKGVGAPISFIALIYRLLTIKGRAGGSLLWLVESLIVLRSATDIVKQRLASLFSDYVMHSSQINPTQIWVGNLGCAPRNTGYCEHQKYRGQA